MLAMLIEKLMLHAKQYQTKVHDGLPYNIQNKHMKLNARWTDWN